MSKNEALAIKTSIASLNLYMPKQFIKNLSCNIYVSDNNFHTCYIENDELVILSTRFTCSIYSKIVKKYRNEISSNELNDIKEGYYIEFDSEEQLNEYFNNPILDDKEKEYLSAVIRPFKGRVLSITKLFQCVNEFKCELIKIKVQGGVDTHITEGIYLPYFEKESMYKNMTLNKDYNLKELDLD